MKLPPHGYCSPCTFLQLRSADHVMVQTPARVRFEIRLTDACAPGMEGHSIKEGLAAREFADGLLDAADHLSIYIPNAGVIDRLIRDGWDGYTVVIHGQIFLGTEQSLGEALVQSQHAVTPGGLA